MLRNSKLKINIMEKTWNELLSSNFKLRRITYGVNSEVKRMQLSYMGHME
jgi:hypothetical protein